jgi:hypothetical protein
MKRMRCGSPTAIAKAAACLVLASAAVAWAAKPHEHGTARLDIAIEAGSITLQLESPLDNLLAFERAPRSDAERKSADAMVARLKAADTLFKPDPAAQCTLATVTLNSSALKLGPPDAAAEADGHADIDASIEFTCKDAGKATFIDVTLFDAFARMKHIDVQVAAPKGQFKRVLTAPARRVVLTR